MMIAELRTDFIGCRGGRGQKFWQGCPVTSDVRGQKFWQGCPVTSDVLLPLTFSREIHKIVLIFSAMSGFDIDEAITPN